MPRKKTLADEALLDLVLGLLIQGGADVLTLKSVSKQVGLSPSTLIQRFGNRETMIDRALQRATEKVKASTEVPQQASREALVCWLVDLANSFQTREQLVGSLSLLSQDLRDESSQRAKIARTHMATIRDGIASQLKALNCDDPENSASIVEAQWQGLVLQWGLSGTDSLQDWMRTGLEKILHLVLPSARKLS